MQRHWKDGKPYYCETCGIGYGEYMACEDVACKLESEAEAQKRAAEPDDADAVLTQDGWTVPNHS